MPILGVRLRDGFYSFLVPVVTIMVGICPLDFFRKFYSFIDLFYDLHSFKHIASLFIYLTLEIPPLEVGLFGPSIEDGVDQNLVEIYFVNSIALIQLREQC